MVSKEYLYSALVLLALSFIQNVSFSIVSRSRNRSSLKFHLIAAIFSNSIWFLTFRHLVTRDMGLYLFPWYCIGTVVGSLQGVKISMWIERKLHADSDSHLKPKVNLEQLQKEVTSLREQISYHRRNGFWSDNEQDLPHVDENLRKSMDAFLEWGK